MLVEVRDRTTRIRQIQRVRHLKHARGRDRSLVQRRADRDELAHRPRLERVLHGVHLLRVRVIRLLRIRIRDHQDMAGRHVLDNDRSPVRLVLRDTRVQQVLDLMLQISVDR